MNRSIHYWIGKKTLLGICLVYGLLAGLFFPPSVQAQTTNNEFWICTNATHAFLLNWGGYGISNNPLDGSSQSNFDLNLGNVPDNGIIHILPGKYSTLGGIKLRSGVHVLGSGMDVTTIQLLPGVADGTIMMINAGQGGISTTNNLVSGLTLDCNYTPDSGSKSYGGIILEGTRHVISGVRLLNPSRMSSASSEAWGLIIANWNLKSSVSNVIENCVVSNFNYGTLGNLSAIGFLGGNGISGASGVIRNNRIYGSVSNNPVIFGLLLTGDTVASGNYMNGVAVATRSEGAFTNIVFTNNIIKCCSVAVDYFKRRYLNITFGGNQIELTNSVFNTMPVAFDLGSEDWNTGGQNIKVTNNIVTYVGNSNDTPVFLYAIGLTNLTVLKNKFPQNFINYISNCSNIHIDSDSQPLDAPVLHSPM